MTRDTRIWICPELCGCELTIDAVWVKTERDSDATRDNLSYQHPIPFKISSIQIQSVCASHSHFTTDAAITDETYNGEMRGYLGRVPSTEAEKLYVALTRYATQRLTPDTCNCRIALCVNRVTRQEAPKRHFKHTRKCAIHSTDDDAHTDALENMSRKNRILLRIMSQFNVAESAITWNFSPERVLNVNISGITNTQRNQAQTWADTNLGVGRVIVTNT